MMRTLFISIFSVLIITKLVAQKEPIWDNTVKTEWNKAFQVIDIPSTADGKIQKAYFYTSKSKLKKPLIISLHTWSGTYAQKDPLTREILARDWNYIHPDFRGVNNTPEAVGSHLVISDIEDAIQHALKNSNADPQEVHIIGVSGGGFATLAAYMNITYPVKSFSAWAPISDLEAWYWESVGRKQKYAADVLKAVSADTIFNAAEARLRSPLFQKFQIELRKNSKLFIYEGIHDGYDGSVPITHSINMYNRLVTELKYGTVNTADQQNDSSLVSDKVIIDLLTKRTNPLADSKNMLFDRKIQLLRQFENISLTIFEGGHEQIPQALGLIPYNFSSPLKLNILTLGDSNGQMENGWVNQLKAMLPMSTIFNNSKGGRTIGFDNNGRRDLNALANIEIYLNDARQKIGKNKLDYMVLCLGTNDTKADFVDKQNEVIKNFTELLLKIKQHSLYIKSKPRLVFVTPPPIRTTNILAKYDGANDRLKVLIPQFTTIARKKRF
jgi:lysophospholipase L1-like esterase/pimeloyl-ACP methyl ester carboxylesterase